MLSSSSLRFLCCFFLENSCFLGSGCTLKYLGVISQELFSVSQHKLLACDLSHLATEVQRGEWHCFTHKDCSFGIYDSLSCVCLHLVPSLSSGQLESSALLSFSPGTGDSTLWCHGWDLKVECSFPSLYFFYWRLKCCKLLTTLLYALCTFFIWLFLSSQFNSSDYFCRNESFQYVLKYLP